MTEEVTVKELTRKRASIKSQLTQFTNFLATAKSCEQLSEEQLVELDIRIEKIVTVYATYDQLQSQLEFLSARPDEQFTEREQFESIYYRQLAAARALLSRHRAQLGSKVGSNEQLSVVTRHNNVRLPKINLPHFSGGYRDWLEFKDIYVSLIHEEKSIDNINKFHYLRSSLNGSAALVIKSLDFRGDNYDNAWQLLCERYDNKQLLVNNHVHALFNVEPLQKESSQGLREIVDVTRKNLRSLATLGRSVQHWDDMVIHLMASKLDTVTSRQWEEHRNSLTEYPSLDEFIKFISNRCNLLETLEEAKSIKSKPESSHSKPKSFSVLTSKGKSDISCPLCKQKHYIFTCDQFKALAVAARLSKAKEFKLCLNCLRPGHFEATCPLGHCKYCKNRHNTMLHSHDDNPSSSKEHITLAGTNYDYSSRHVLLSTALVRVTDNSGTPHSARVLLDNGSTANFVTKDLCGKLHLPIRSVSSHVAGINSQVSTITQSCTVHLQSCDGSYNIDIDCFVLPNITTHIPHTYIDLTDLQLPAGVSLADPSFNVPSTIDILVGADIFWGVIGRNRIQLGRHMPTLFETKLGWLISGAIPQPNSTHSSLCMVAHDRHTTHVQAPMDLSRFWELDSISPKFNYTSEERACEQNYKTTTRRNADGRFVVTIPLKESPEALGNSFEMAKRRFLSLERRLDRDPTFKRRYVEFLQEYEALGHMSEASQPSSSHSYFLPHHGVFRESSTTTKLRVVFDASAVTTSGKSFNDIQGIGPRVQDDLISILLRFRQHKYVISSDIEKFFRQIEVDESQRPLQQILWRSDPSLPLKTYTLNTVTYGTASAPFISTRCLSQLAKEATHTRTQQSIQHDFYVDDYLSGSDSIESTIALCRDVISTLKTAQLNLRKWQSNNSQILQAVTTSIAHPSPTQPTSTSHTDTPSTVSLSIDEPSKTLGLNWHCHTDCLTFSIHVPEHTVTLITKRHILSTIAQVFDPLGLVSPCIIEIKIILQKLWIDKCAWDDEVNEDIKRLWLKFTQTLPQLNHLSIPRWVVSDSPTSVEMHIFTDASEKAYGACIYIRSVARSGTVHTHLLTSKSKVAPIKSTTIPRLELCGALLGTRLCAKVLESLTLKPDKCIFWCDSMIVLGWLSASPSTLKPFVRHRVSEIREGFGDYTWRYVPSKDNPADLVSRGLGADLIGQSTMWWSGPSFLLTDSALWPLMPNSEADAVLPELLKSHFTNINSQSLPITNTNLNTNTENSFHTLINNSSNYLHVQRLLAYVFRFINRSKREHNHSPTLTCSELTYSAEFMVKTVQREMFPEEYELLSSGKPLPNKNRLKKLSPFIESGIIRVGGRLDNSCYDYNVRHPIIICSKHNFSKLIFNFFHLRLFHAGPQLLLATIRHEYWPLGGRNLAKTTVHKCVKCQRFAGRTVQPIMGNLPKERVQLEFPFLETGTDYAGPILIADRKGRGCRLIKSYICVFVCLATRAVHLELVSDLTKHAFIAALNRFIARRGKPRTIYSDNGTTFVGTCNEIADILKQDLSSEMANSGINFNFIPAYTPHFGGLWESAVKSIKHHLRRILGLAHLTYEEMSTCLIQVEAILNSRPLTPLSTDPSDLYPLTPAHFLIGRSLTSLPHPQVSNQNVSSLKRYQRIEHLKQQFWNRFSNEYIFYLQQRTKWTDSDGMLEEGTMVVLKEKLAPPLMWPLGRIVRLIPGRDGISRVADVKTKKGIVRRAYNTICPLPA